MFSAVEEQERIGTIIRESVVALLQSRSQFSERFSDTDQKGGIDGRIGSYASMQGLRAVFGAAVAIEDPDLWQEISAVLPSLLGEWETVLDEFRGGFYSVTPYYPDPRSLLQITDNSPYIDTISWALSTAVLINYVATQSSNRLRASIPESLVEKTRDQIVRALQLLVAAQADDGGWSWSAAYKRGHLYFTWSASEGLADFFDYVVGESERELGISRDDDTMKYVMAKDAGLMKELSAARAKCRDFLAAQLERAFAASDWNRDDFTEKEKVGTVTFARLMPTDDSATSLHLFYFDLYLLEALILNNFDYTIDGTAVDEENRQRLGRLYQKVSSKLPGIRAAAKTDEFCQNPGASTLRMTLSPKQSGRSRTPPFEIQDPGLWPQLLRTLVLYRFYPAPSAIPDAAIVEHGDGALDLVLQDRRPAGAKTGDGLWDQFDFNLSVTARAIEGLIDVFDYCGLLMRLGPPLDRPKPPQEAAPLDLVEVMADAIFPRIAAKLAAESQAREQQRTSAPSPRGDVPSAEQINTRIIDKVVEIFASLEEPLDRNDVAAPITVANVVERLIGQKRAGNLAEESDAHHALLRAIAWISYNTTVQMLEWIVQEAAIRQHGKDELGNPYRSTDPNDLKMAYRIGLGLKALIDTEARSHGIDYKRSVERIFTSEPGENA